MTDMSHMTVKEHGESRRLQTKGLGQKTSTNVKFLPLCFFWSTNVPSGERNVAYGYSETKGLLPLVQNRLSFATRTQHSVFPNSGQVWAVQICVFIIVTASHSHSGNFLNARRKRNVEYVEVIRHGTLRICSMREYLEKLSVLKFSSQDLLERFNTWQLTPTCTRKDMFSDPFSGVVLNSLIWNLKLFLLT